MAQPPPKIEISKHPDFKVIHVNGAWILLKPDEGFMKFYLDVVEPKIKASGQPGQLEIDKINREFQVEVRMSTMAFLQIASYMEAHIKELEKKGIVKREKKIPEAQPYRV